MQTHAELGIGPRDLHGSLGGIAGYHQTRRSENPLPMSPFDRPIGAVRNPEVVGVDDESNGSVSRNHERCSWQPDNF